jgi:hypothetical protein
MPQRRRHTEAAAAVDDAACTRPETRPRRGVLENLEHAGGQSARRTQMGRVAGREDASIDHGTDLGERTHRRPLRWGHRHGHRGNAETAGLVKSDTPTDESHLGMCQKAGVGAAGVSAGSATRLTSRETGCHVDAPDSEGSLENLCDLVGVTGVHSSTQGDRDAPRGDAV